MTKSYGFANLILAALLASCSKAQFGQPKNTDFKGVSVLEKNTGGSDVGAQGKSEMVAEAQPALVIEAVKPAPLAMSPQFSFTQNRFVLEADKPVEVTWTLDADLPELDVFTISVLGPDEKIILQQEVTPSSTLKGSTQTFKFEFSKEPNTFYTFTVGGYNKDRSYIQPAQGTIIVDSEAPKGRIYLGAQGSSDPCARPPLASLFVATRVVPSQICLNDQKGLGSGVDKFCLIQNSSGLPETVPPKEDTCWKDASSFVPQVLLTSENEGVNYFHLFIKDKVGNVGQDAPQVIKIVPSDPPKVGVVSPSSAELASSKWIAGQEKVLRWRVSDQDTLALDIRIVVSLINRNDRSDFVNLGCSFSDPANAPQKLCPAGTLASPSDFQRSSDGSGQFRFTVGAWNLTKPYMLAVSAIDKAGNASVITTSEINADWEVIAGRSYNGFGGTGTDVQATELWNLVAADRLGQLYNTSAHKDGNFKVRALDGRTCRFSKPVGAGATPFDCADIIETNEPILGKEWTYISHKDSFYAVGNGYLMEINFNMRTVKRLSGKGLRLLPTDMANVNLEDLGAISSLVTRVAYEAQSKSVFFVASNRFYRIDQDNKVSFVLGSGQTQTSPLASASAKPMDLDLPAGFGGFSVSPDGRILFSASAPVNWNIGSGYALQYVVDNIKWGDLERPATLMVFGGEDAATGMKTTKNADGTAIKNISRSPSDPNRSVYWYTSFVNHTENALYFTGAWWGLYRIKLPPSGSSEDQYKVESISRPIVSFLAYMMAPIHNSSVIYLSDWSQGYIMQFDTSKNNYSVVTGAKEFPLSNELSENISLSAPRYFHRMSDSEIYFSDYNGLRKATLESTGWNILTMMTQADSNFMNGALRIFSSEQKMIQTNLSTLRSTPIDNPSQATTQILKSPENIRASSYPNQYGHSNSSAQPKMFMMNTTWDGKEASGGQMIIAEYDPALSGVVKGTSLAANANLGSHKCGADGLQACAQGDTLVDSETGGRYFSSGTYRIPAVGTQYLYRSAQTVAAFSSNDEIVYTCGSNNNFLAIKWRQGKVFAFEVSEADNTKVPCPVLGGSFETFEDTLYYSVFGQFYKLTNNNIFNLNRATFQKLDFGKFPAGFSLNQFEIVSSGARKLLYASDLGTHRMLRKVVVP